LSIAADCDPLADALIDLHTTLSGGRAWSPPEMATMLSAHGFEAHGDIGQDSAIYLVAGRKS